MRLKQTPAFPQLDLNTAGRIPALRGVTAEKAFLTRRLETAAESLARFDRLYFGCEFCDRNLPSVNQTKEAAALCRKEGKGFTLVTPLCTDAGIARVKKILRALDAFPRIEVVVNDFGVLRLLQSFPGLTPVAGRLLMKQKSDPRLGRLESRSMKKSLKKTAADNEEFAALLRAHGVRMVELDNTILGFEPPRGFHISVYYPFVFLTLTMKCCLGDCRTCDEKPYLLRHPDFPVDILLKGNAQFYRNNSLKGLRNIAVHRMVLQGTLPG